MKKLFLTWEGMANPASVRAFRDFLKKAQIYGADIDKKILFKEDRIILFMLTSQISTV